MMSDLTINISSMKSGAADYARSGLVGLVTVLKYLQKKGTTPFKFKVDWESITLMDFNLENAQDIAVLLDRVYALDNGKITLPVLEPWAPEQKSRLMDLIVHTFWQHGKSRKGIRTDAGDYILTNLAHRNVKLHTDLAKACREKKWIGLRNWILPGSDITVKVPPDVFLSMLFLPFSCLYYHDAKTMFDSYYYSMIRVGDIDKASDALLKYYLSPPSEIRNALNVEHAHLQSLYVLDTYSMPPFDCATVKMGKVAWNKQQIVRRGYFTRQREITPGALTVFKDNLGHLERHSNLRTEYNPFVGQFCKNLLELRHPFSNFGEYCTSSTVFLTWKRELKGLMNYQPCGPAPHYVRL